MISILILPVSLRATLAAEALRAYPRECCGLIEGAARDDAIEALALHPARNLAKEIPTASKSTRPNNFA